MTNSNIYKHILYITVSLAGILQSCQKTQSENIGIGDALLNINLTGIEYESQNEIRASNENIDANAFSNKHIQYVNENFHIESQLIPVNDSKTNNLKNNIKQNASAEILEIDKNIKYKILVYNAAGNLLASRDYAYKKDSDETAIPLNTYTDYTFVVVSSRSASDMPNIENINNLNNAKISTVDTDLLYWKSEKMKLKKGNNFLAVKLRPKFSEVTTTIIMDNTMTGSITSISNMTFNTVAQKASLDLKEGNLTFSPQIRTDKPCPIPTIYNQRTVTIPPVKVIHNGTTNGSLKFESLTVDGETKKNITISGLSFQPGRKYNLILTLKTCTQSVSGLNGFNWDFSETTKTINEGTTWRPNNVTYTGINFKPTGSNTTTFKKNGEIISFEFNEAGADYGFVYDILELDNAFNLEVNGTPLVGTSVTAHEIQFQNNATSTTQNIEFEDGSQYQSIGNNNIAANKRVKSIWEFKGTVAKPTIRVVIGRNGDVNMYGSKTDQGELFPLRLKNNLQFNTLKWKGDNQTNIIKATTRIEGKTTMKSSGSGRKKVTCDN